MVNLAASNSRFLYRKRPTNSKITIEISLGICPFLKEFRNHNEIINAIIIPTTGARKIKLAVFKIMALLIVLNPP